MSQVQTELHAKIEADKTAGEALLGGFFKAMYGAGLGGDKSVVRLRSYFIVNCPDLISATC